MIVKKVAIIFLLEVSAYGICQNAPMDPCKSVIITVPKTGTHLLCKCVSELLNRKVDWSIDSHVLSYPQAYFEQPTDDLYTILEQTKQAIWITHLMYKSEYADVFVQTTSPFFLCYRDPRDQVVSLARMMKSLPERWPAAIDVPMDAIIMDLIQHNKLSNGFPPTKGILDLYNSYIPWLKVPGCCPVRFEDLIGEKGGGSDAKQIEEIQKIARHVGINLSEIELKAIANKLFGESPTFNISQSIINLLNSGTVKRCALLINFLSKYWQQSKEKVEAEKFKAGQIGSWKNAFSEEHKKVFKNIAGQLLIDLGYEKNMEW